MIFLIALILTVASTQVVDGQTYIFPHFANGLIGDGTRWTTEIDILNSSSTTQRVKVSFFNQDGTPKKVTLPGGSIGPVGNLLTTAVFESDVQPNLMFRLETDGGINNKEPQAAGWVLLEGSAAIKVAFTFRRRDSNDNILAEAAILPSPPASTVEFIPVIQEQLIQGQTILQQADVGFALANADLNLQAVGELQYLANGGQVLETSSFVLPPRAQIAQFVKERFQRNRYGSIDYLRIRLTSGSVSAVALRTVGDRLISTIPAN